jgi:hypothetical protein
MLQLELYKWLPISHDQDKDTQLPLNIHTLGRFGGYACPKIWRTTSGLSPETPGIPEVY